MLRSFVAACLALSMFCATGAAEVDLRQLVGRADLRYDKPASRSEEGMPIGNGRMGSLIWTTPSSIRMQVNRPDVFADDCTTMSFPRTHSDYASSCAFVDIDLPDFSRQIFAAEKFKQHLSVYGGLMTLEGDGITARAFALTDRDVFAI